MQIEIFLTFKKWIVELLFPSRCVGCNIEGVWLCQECAEVIEVFPPEVCPICQGMTSDYQLCQKCRRHYNFSKVLIRSRYQNSTVRSIIQGIKYNYIKDLRSSFVPLFQDQFEDYFKQTEIDYILIPVPLHKKRLKQREYNQSELLADSISKILERLGNLSFSKLQPKDYVYPEVEGTALAEFTLIVSLFKEQIYTLKLLNNLAPNGDYVLSLRMGISLQASASAIVEDSKLRLEMDAFNQRVNGRFFEISSWEGQELIPGDQ